MKHSQELFTWNYLVEHGLTEEEASEAIRLDNICRIDTPRRIYNNLKKEEGKDREKQEDMRRKYNPNPAARVIRSYNNQYVIDL